jgi:3-phenylpropionate/trans-cinnamate dioxygenase ferredoxin component
MAWHDVAADDGLGDDEALAVTVGERQIALCRSGGEVYALDNVCTHQYALLSDGYVEEGTIECPLHQGRFALATGAPLCAPVTQPVRTYPVRREAGRILVELEE